MTTQALNSLAKASSAYLRSAMHQPIQWHEWSKEAFERAQRENKPVLLDIGAVWCHWCHVMDRESYDNPEIAEIINQRFVAVKVDRDERPDVDSRYQVAIQAVSGQGGWPLTAFLTPDGKPFYGGTYFPPDDHYGRPSFKRVLLSIANAYHEKNGDVVEQAKMVEGAIAQSESFAGRSGDFSPQVIEAIVQTSLKMFDERNGGFGSAPKFFHPAILDLIMNQYTRSRDDQLLKVIATTLEKMASGGVYDQLAGGFHRYSVDERWIVPHFEKMSYDNSELLKNYVHGFQVTGSEFFAAVAKEIIRWMDEWLSDRERGGFYASQDADYSMDDDGDYFTWTLAETRAVLTEEETNVASLHYDINEIGEMHHAPAKNVLYIGAGLEEITKRLNISAEQVATLLAVARKKMYAARLKRPTPYVDKTIYVGWNALAISAYLEAATILELEDARHFALRSLDRILAEGWDTERGLRHVIAYSDPKSERRDIPGMLDDYAFASVACLDAFEASGDLTYFKFARAIADKMVARFFDSTSGGFFDTEQPSDASDKRLGVLHTHRKPFQDSPTPAGNAVAAIAMTRLHAYTNEPSYRDKAEQTLEVLAGIAGQYGLFAATYGVASAKFAEPHLQVVVLRDSENSKELERAAVESFALNKTVFALPKSAAIAPNLPPALAETIPNFAKNTKGSVAIVCSGFTCLPPISDPDELRRLLRERARQAK
ncbi:MAG TPA: thioredoxin domain-containing protein [Terriglobales bacterium]|jgi:hypothetical protein